MPVIKNYQYQNMPKWAELQKYQQVFVGGDEVLSLDESSYEKVVLMCLSGTITVREGERETVCSLGQTCELKSGKAVITAQPYFFVEKAFFMLMCGNWKSASFNMFRADIYENPINHGTPTEYYRNCGFDNHFHDFDEYWIIYQGHGVAYSEDIAYEVGPGDCVATGIGWHHDFPIVHDYVCAVTVETEGVGQDRPDHLWEQVHGKAEPHLDRV